MQQFKGTAFTIKGTGGLLRVLVSPALIIVPNSTTTLNVQAIWDTGATGSVITKKVAAQLGLVPTGMVNVSTANGMAVQNTYTIDIGLPNKAKIQGIICTEVDGLSGGCDALIGMDIITLGDFSITNHKGITCMSFRVPSSHEIDYVKNLNYGVTPITSFKQKGAGTNFTPPKKKRR